MVEKVGEYRNNYIKWHQSFSRVVRRGPDSLARVQLTDAFKRGLTVIDYQLAVERTVLTESLSRYNFTLRSVSMHSHFFICEHQNG